MFSILLLITGVPKIVMCPAKIVIDDLEIGIEDGVEINAPVEIGTGVGIDASVEIDVVAVTDV